MMITSDNDIRSYTIITRNTNIVITRTLIITILVQYLFRETAGRGESFFLTECSGDVPLQAVCSKRS